MNELKQQHENAKRRATLLMKKGKISEYFNALLEMQQYKKLMVAVIAN